MEKNQKQFFEQEAIRDKVGEILDETEKIVASEKDKVIFFEALANPPKPNQELISAKNAYDQMIAKCMI